MVLKRAAAAHHDRSVFGLQPAHPATFGTGLLVAQLAGLLLRRHFQGAGQQPTHRRHGHVFHLRQINVQPRALLAPPLPHDDFSPAARQFLDSLEIFRGRFACGHVASLQRVPSFSPLKSYPSAAYTSPPAAK